MVRFLLQSSALLFIALISFQMITADMKPINFQNEYAVKLADFQKASLHYQTAINKQKKVPESYLNLRKAFKKVEFLIAYIDPALHKKNFNGAPLPYVVSGTPDLSINQPHGLQVIDELMENPEANRHKLIFESNILYEAALDFSKVYENMKLYDRHIFEASRKELIRVISLNLSGFDTPAFGNKYTDSKASLESLRQFVSLLSATNNQTANYKKTVLSLLDGALHYIEKNKTDETFDHFLFYQKFIQPAYATLLDYQLAMGVETIDEVSFTEQPFNYNARQLFSNDFLNPSFFIPEIKGENKAQVEELGQLLFFDPVLSANNLRSCASCHNPQKAFADGQIKSLAFNENGTVNRNSPTLINAVFATNFFWDMRAKELEKQMKHVVFSEKEFNTSFLEIIDKINQSEEYRQYFKTAFPAYKEKAINRGTISRALSAYIATLTSFDSPFDKSIRGEVTPNEALVKGFNTFMGKGACGTCHFLPSFAGLVPPDFKDTEGEVLGVTSTFDTIHPVLDADRGRFEAGFIREKAPHYMHAFKTPSVRNSGLTEPYMHNGAFKSLEEVVEFYNHGGGNGLGLQIENQTLSDAPLGLTKDEKSNLIAFLKSLNDTTVSNKVPSTLPKFPAELNLNNRLIGGSY